MNPSGLRTLDPRPAGPKTLDPRLDGKHICICITGSVASVRAFDLARLLIKFGAKVTCVASSEALRFVAKESLEWATGNPVIDKITYKCEHLELAKCDAVVIAPASANTISKIALGIADTPVTLVAQSALTQTPAIIAPAMHRLLMNPIIKENLKKLEKLEKVTVIPSVKADGKEKLADVEEIADYAIRAVATKRLEGKRILIVGGAFREYIDDVRFISNGSSGRFSVALAKECFYQGADVTLVHGKTEVAAPKYVETMGIETTTELIGKIEEFAKGKCIILFPAALNDFSIVKKKDGKFDSTKRQPIELAPLPKAIKIAREANRTAKIIGYKAEVSSSVNAEKIKRLLENCDSLVWNDIGKHGFGSDENEIIIFAKSGKEIGKFAGMKDELAERIIDLVQ